MGSVGNNISASVAYVRDCFLQGSEDVYSYKLIYDMEHNSRVKKPFLGSLPTEKINLIYASALQRLSNGKNNGSIDQKVLSHIQSMFEFKYCNGTLCRVLYDHVSPACKVVLAEAINDVVELEQFTEEEMQVVEDSMGIILGTIEDLHRVRFRELDYDNFSKVQGKDEELER
ncbi:MAG: hypothetical protein IJW59_02695 [Clostridia bacterium]|nr:hypothetical protein [Clostridia bacterium]